MPNASAAARSTFDMPEPEREMTRSVDFSSTSRVSGSRAAISRSRGARSASANDEGPISTLARDIGDRILLPPFGVRAVNAIDEPDRLERIHAGAVPDRLPVQDRPGELVDLAAPRMV